MSTYPTAVTQINVSTPQETPEIGTGAKEPEKLISWVDSRIRYDAPLKVRRDRKNNKASMFRQAVQWLQASGYGLDPSKTPFWAGVEYDPDDENAIPTPVQPEIVVHLQNEAARLGAPEFKPYVRPSGDDPTAKEREGAKLATQSLQFNLKQMAWPEIEADGCMHDTNWGQWIIKSFWEEDWLNTVKVPVTEGVCCPGHPAAVDRPNKPETPGPDEEVESGPQPPAPDDTPEHENAETSQQEALEQGQEPPVVNPIGMMNETAFSQQDRNPCTFILANKQVKPEIAQQMSDAFPASVQSQESQVNGTATYTAQKCPQCVDHPDLVPAYPTLEESVSAKDSFNQPLGLDKPKGDWKLRNVIPHDWFPPAQGVGLRFEELPYWCEVYAAPVQWIAAHFQSGDKVKAESAEALMHWHPATGDRSVYTAGLYGDTVFEGWARVKEYHEKPSRKFPDGRSIIISGNQVLLDSTFLVQSQMVPGEKFPRVRYDCATWEPLPHSSWGMGLAELLFSLQESINETRAMADDRMTRMGIVGWMATRGMNLESRSWGDGGGAGKLYEWDPDPLSANLKPEMTQAATMPEMPGLINLYTQAMGRIAGAGELETTGEPQGGVSSFIGMQFQAQKTAERRRPRIRRIREMLERVWTHGLTLMYHRYLEHRRVEFQDDDRAWKEKSFRGIDLAGQVQVRIDPEPEHDTALQLKQQIMDLMQQGFFDMTNPAVKAQIADKLEVPSGLDADMSLQREGASREFCAYRDEGRDPVRDESLDDDSAHKDQHGHDMHSDYWRDCEEAADWDRALLALNGWKMDIPRLVQKILKPQTDAQQAQQAQYQMVSQQYMAQGVPPPPPPDPLPLVVPAQEILIFQAWQMLLQERGYQPKDADEAKALLGVLRFRAHYQAHVMGNQSQISAASAGAPVAAAPEAENQTAAGTVAGTTGPAPESAQPQPQAA